MSARVYKKIEYYLYNYDYIDIKIDNIKSDILYTDYNQSYTRWINNKGSSLENQAIQNVNLKSKIYELRKWKKLIEFTLRHYLNSNHLKYKYIYLKYFDKCNYLKINEKLNISFKQQKKMQNEIIRYIYLVATKNDMLKDKNY